MSCQNFTISFKVKSEIHCSHSLLYVKKKACALFLFTHVEYLDTSCFSLDFHLQVLFDNFFEQFPVLVLLILFYVSNNIIFCSAIYIIKKASLHNKQL